MMHARQEKSMRPATAGGMVSAWAIVLAVVLAIIQRMPVALAVLLTIITIGVPAMASRRCPGLLRRWWMWPIVLLLLLDVGIIWEAVVLFDEKATPAARAKEADARRRAAALE